MDLKHNSVLLVEFSPSPCLELKRISMKLSKLIKKFQMILPKLKV